jgi:hypothetical protein
MMDASAEAKKPRAVASSAKCNSGKFWQNTGRPRAVESSAKTNSDKFWQSFGPALRTAKR